MRTFVGTSVRNLVRTIVAAALLCIYLPHVGRGFVQDDFAWVLQGRGEVADVIARAFTTSTGFYRPLVTQSFALTEPVAGLEPFWYGLTNLLLMLACAAGVERLARRVGLAPWYALLAAAVWAFNFHGIGMSVLWISGRTSLLSTLFAVCAATSFHARRTVATIVWTILALFSKEEAVLLPFILTAWAALGGSKDPPLHGVGGADGSVPFGRGGSLDPPRALRECWTLFAALAGYLVLRGQSGAFTPLTAPDYYQFMADPARLAKNLAEYADRSGTIGVTVVILLMLAARALPRLDAAERTIAMKGAIWWLGGFAITMWLPIRSSLYAVFPSVGVALIAAALAASLAPKLAPGLRTRLLVAGVLLPFLLLPVYWSRNQRWVELADLSASTLARVRADLPRIPDAAIVALEDEPATRANFINAFGGLAPEAGRLFLERGIDLRIDPPADPTRPRHVIHLADIPLGRTEGRGFRLRAKRFGGPP